MTRRPLARALGVLAALLALAGGCNGPGPLTPLEVRWRWRHGKLLDTRTVDDGGVAVVVACPQTDGRHDVVARFTLRTREVREFERRDPFGRRDPLRFLAERRCEDAAASTR